MSQPVLQLRMFDPATDYPIVEEWWKAHGWSAVPQVMLPKLGVVAFYSGNKIEDAAAAWLYMDNSSPVCMLEWMVTNPTLSATKTVRALKHIAEFLTGEAKHNGYAAMLTTCKQDSLAKFHEKNGFDRTDSAMIHLLKTL
jgi:hypothetical protein